LDRPLSPPVGLTVSTISASRRFAQLSGSDRTIVLKSAICLSASWAGLRIAGFRRWKNLLDRFVEAPAADPSPSRLPEATHLTRLLCSASRHLFLRTNCLEQAMTLYFLLRRRGIAAELHFGARKRSEALEAHAWVTSTGVPLNEDHGEHRHFLPFDGLDPRLEALPD
jgi:hypothetical protein